MNKDQLWNAYCKQFNVEWFNDHHGMRKAMEKTLDYQGFVLGIRVQEFFAAFMRKR